MRGERRAAHPILAAGLTLAALLGLSGCGGRGTAARAQHVPAPADPDLGTVMERFYGDVEGRHWNIAYGMLAPDLRRSLSRDDFVAQYARFTDADATLRQRDARTVVAVLVTHDRADPRERRFEETWTLAWDGETWTLAALRRREL